MPTPSIAKPSKIDTIWDFWLENMASGNPAADMVISWDGFYIFPNLSIVYIF
jgi:hypothetical protein